MHTFINELQTAIRIILIKESKSKIILSGYFIINFWVNLYNVCTLLDMLERFAMFPTTKHAAPDKNYIDNVCVHLKNDMYDSEYCYTYQRS